MKNNILIAALACASVAAFAQSSNSAQSSSTSSKTVSQPAGSNASLNSSDKTAAPRDVATGQASGKRQHQPVTAPQTNSGQSDRESSAPSVSEVVVTKPSGNKSAQDHWDSPAMTQTGNGSTGQQPRVATGDVNGDGRADVAISQSPSNGTSPKDSATGHASGKRQHDPLTIKKEVDASSPAK
jgi:FG-GAP repeat